MDFFEYFNISERYIDIINPLSREKVTQVGEKLHLSDGGRVIDFGCGYAEPLTMWAQAFGIGGIGIDIREPACQKARQKIAKLGLEDRLEIVCAKGAEYPFASRVYDAATCLGATFIWNGFAPAIHALKRAIHADGRIAVGEPYWRADDAPAKCRELEASILSEPEIIAIIRREGFELEYVIRSSQDDWDTYEASNWKGLLAWLEENPDHHDRADVLSYLQKTQDDYARCFRHHLGWAVYILRPGSEFSQ